MKQISIIAVFILFVGCTHNMTVNSNFVASNTDQFKSEKLGRENVFLVVSPEFEGYVFEKKAYNWAGGSMFKDTLYFDLGKALSTEIGNLISTMFGEKYEVTDIKKAVNKNGIIVKPEIIDSTLDLPAIRGGDIKAEIQVEYSFYDSDGKHITSQSVSGNGTKALVMTKENYNIAFGEAIKDVIGKSKSVIENVAMQKN